MKSPRRATILNLFMIGTVVSSISLVLRPAGRDSQHAKDATILTKSERPKINRSVVTATPNLEDEASTTIVRPASAVAVNSRDNGTRVEQPKPGIEAPPDAREIPQPSGRVVGSVTQTGIESSADPSAQAIQLADDVRLPAALMPSGLADVPPEVAAAAVEIANTYYRNLQAETTTPRTHPTPFIDGKDTTLIRNTPGTERIREDADEVYRALYGDTQYIRHTISSAIEVNLPPEPTQR